MQYHKVVVKHIASASDKVLCSQKFSDAVGSLLIVGCHSAFSLAVGTDGAMNACSATVFFKELEIVVEDRDAGSLKDPEKIQDEVFRRLSSFKCKDSFDDASELFCNLR